MSEYYTRVSGFVGWIEELMGVGEIRKEAQVSALEALVGVWVAQGTGFTAKLTYEWAIPGALLRARNELRSDRLWHEGVVVGGSVDGYRSVVEVLGDQMEYRAVYESGASQVDVREARALIYGRVSDAPLLHGLRQRHAEAPDSGHFRTGSEQPAQVVSDRVLGNAAESFAEL